MQRYFPAPVCVQPSLGLIYMKLGIDFGSPNLAHQKTNKSYDVFKSHNFVNVIQ